MPIPLTAEHLEAAQKRLAMDDYDLLIRVLLRTGVRTAELYRVESKDFLGNGKVYIHACKGSVNREVHLKDLEAPFRAFVDRFGSMSRYCHTNKPETFTNALRKAWAGRRLFLFGEVGRRYGLHSLRATGATKIWNETKDILLVQSFLGHKSLTSTQLYIPKVDRDLIWRHVI